MQSPLNYPTLYEQTIGKGDRDYRRPSDDHLIASYFCTLVSTLQAKNIHFLVSEEETVCLSVCPSVILF